MRNLSLEIEYDGTDYCGWQIQKSKKPSIQATIETALQKILQEKVRVIASGRTDAGVHASSQVANFKTRSLIPAKKLLKALNSLLPDDIIVSRVREVHPDFHSRFCAKSKTYRYAILNRPYPSALMARTVYFYPYSLDVRRMRSEAKALIGRHNFRSFQAGQSAKRNAVRTIRKIRISRNNGLLSIEIEADGFLRAMVRTIVGTLIEVGRHRFPKGSLKKILASGDRSLAGPTAPAQGLCLMKVHY